MIALTPTREKRRFGRRMRWVLVAALLAPGPFKPALRAQTGQKPTPPILIDSLVGRDLYIAYCGACHGREGKGDGPVGPALKTPPSDLTTIARRNGGKYPAALVEATLNGTRPEPQKSAAHGSSDMPIWGAIFRQLDAKESVARVRVQNLVTYVESLQVR
jgi:mono/diheme cytochrome c family protein